MFDNQEIKTINKLKALYKETKSMTFSDAYKERPDRYLCYTGFIREVSDKTGIEFKKIFNVMSQVKDGNNFYLHRVFYLDRIVEIFNNQSQD